MKLKTFFLFLLLGCSMAMSAQNITVAEFKLRESDMTAASLEGRRIDQNGQPAALIRIETTEKGFVFEAGALGIVDSKQETGEVWVWVPRASRKITIKHPQLGVLYDYRYPIEIEAERTYWMKLVTGKVVTTIEEQVRQQYLIFQLTPHDAILEVDDKPKEVSPDGVWQQFVDFGTYTYRVQAPNYYPDAGKVVVDDPNNKKIVTVNLKPNFGWIEVKGANLQDASVYIDNALVGKAPCKSEALKSGEHTVKIVKGMYDPYSERVTVRDNETTTLSPTLSADFATVTLTVDADAEIWVNDENKGTRQWTGTLGSGTYRIECRMANHEPSVTTKEITERMDGETIVLTAPRPINGSLNVESTPSFAKIFVDGKPMGETPNFIAQILIGSHELKLTKEGYNDYTETITIAKGERKQIKAELNNVNYAQLAKKGDEYYDAKNYEEALKCYREAAENGDPVGQNGMGRLYSGGYAVPKDDVEAVKWFRLAATQGLDRAQCNLGTMYRTGTVVSQDYAEAMRWYRMAADQGFALAQCLIGVMYYLGEGVSQDYVEAVKWYRMAADQGDDNGQCNLGYMYGVGHGVSQDYAEAVKWYHRSAEQGYARAQYNLGVLYENGRGVSQDYAEAVKWYRKAADQGYASAQCILGYMYEVGHGVSQDYAEAVKWYRKAAEQGNAIAQNNLGVLYKNGLGVSQDYNEAVKWYRKAADQGNAHGQCNLGYMYSKGYGVSQSDSEAVKWYRKSAEQGYARAQYNLGVMYENGRGVSKSLNEAKKWYQKAADQGVEDAKNALKRLK